MRVDGSRGPWRDFVNPLAGASIVDDGADRVEVRVDFDTRVVRDAAVESLEFRILQ